MTMLLVMATLLAVVFLVFVSMDGIPSSVSASYYNLGEERWLFEFVMVCVPTMLLPVWLGVSGESHQWMAFLSCGGLIAVGVSPAFRLPFEGAVHYTGAVICGVSAVLWQVFEGLYDVTAFFGLIGGMMALIWRSKWMWWLECAIICSLLGNIWRVI